MDRDLHLLHLLADDVPILGGRRTLRIIHELVDPMNGRAIHRLRESGRSAEGDLTHALVEAADLAGSDWANRRLPTFDDWQQHSEEDDAAAGEGDEEEFLELVEGAATALNALIQVVRRRRATNTSLGLDG